MSVVRGVTVVDTTGSQVFHNEDLMRLWLGAALGRLRERRPDLVSEDYLCLVGTNGVSIDVRIETGALRAQDCYGEYDVMPLDEVTKPQDVQQWLGRVLSHNQDAEINRICWTVWRTCLAVNEQCRSAGGDVLWTDERDKNGMPRPVPGSDGHLLAMRHDSGLAILVKREMDQSLTVERCVTGSLESEGFRAGDTWNSRGGTSLDDWLRPWLLDDDDEDDDEDERTPGD